MDGPSQRPDGDVKWGAFLRSLNTCFIDMRISPEELHNLILPLNSLAVLVPSQTHVRMKIL